MPMLHPTQENGAYPNVLITIMANVYISIDKSCNKSVKLKF